MGIAFYDFYDLKDQKNHSFKNIITKVDFSNTLRYFGIIVYALEGICLILPMRKTYSKYNKTFFNKLLFISMNFFIILYL